MRELPSCVNQEDVCVVDERRTLFAFFMVGGACCVIFNGVPRGDRRKSHKKDVMVFLLQGASLRAVTKPKCDRMKTPHKIDLIGRALIEIFIS